MHVIWLLKVKFILDKIYGKCPKICTPKCLTKWPMNANNADSDQQSDQGLHLPFHVWKPPGRSSRSCYQFSLPATSLSTHMVACTALVCRAQCSMPVRLGHWQSQTSKVCSEMTGKWSDRSAMSNRKTLSPPDPMRYLHGLALRIWTSFWRREGSAGMDMWNAPIVQWQDSLWPTVWWKAWAWEAHDGMEAADREGLQRVEALLSTLMIDIPGDLVWGLPCVQQSSY